MSNDPALPDYQTTYTRRVYAVASIANATTINGILESGGYGPNNLGPSAVPVAGDDDAEATHRFSNAQVKPTGPGGVDELRTLFAALASYAVVDQETKELLETNIAGITVGEPLAFSAFLAACGLKRRVVGIGA